ncbi:MAG TPA: response regulator [Saprospiraceae bacterium]|nr:response regulator [Saprospiraceae bacterium]
MNTHTKFIVVEDNPADLQLTQLAFQNLSLEGELLSFKNGQDLFDYLAHDGASDIAFILLDLNMPQWSGKRILKNLQNSAIWRSIPVVIFSSSLHEQDIKECYALGANAYVTKPFDLQDFERTIESIANFWGRINMRPSVEVQRSVAA